MLSLYLPKRDQATHTNGTIVPGPLGCLSLIYPLIYPPSFTP
jgi:hypothetical protein